MLAINATSYLDTWLTPEQRLKDPHSFLKVVAEGIKKAQESVKERFQTLVVCTHPMDEATCQELANLVDGAMLTNTTYLSHDIQAVIRRCGLLVGMRFHSIVLASSVETPVVGLIYAPKVRGYLRLLKCEDYGLELADVTPQTLSETLVKAWDNRVALQEQQRPTIRDLKAGAEHAADLLVHRYYGEQGATVSANPLAKAV
jgi:polysaccharide pyruvyl transferase WcaK-like protein